MIKSLEGSAPLFLLCCMTFVFFSCKEKLAENPIHQMPFYNIEGNTMGTTYHITFQSDKEVSVIKSQVDSLLNAFEDQLSTYRPESVISHFNKSESGICVDTGSHFINSLLAAGQIWKATDGYFDPSIAPLVNYWGFGYDHQDRKSSIDQDELLRLTNLVGYDKLSMARTGDSICIEKAFPAMQLDLNASAKGLGVDLVADHIEMVSSNYLVEIGGEVRAKGINSKGSAWTLGINRPAYGAATNDVVYPVKVVNQGLATSGNYRNYYRDGQLVYAHIINPKTGQSQPTDLLSVSILADRCEVADGYATALMALGLEGSRKLLSKNPTIAACLIYKDQSADSLAMEFINGFKGTE